MTEYNPQTEDTTAEQPELKVEEVVKDFVDHQVNSLREAVKAVDALLPEGFKQHGAESIREMGRSYAVILNAGLDVLNRMGKSVDEALKRTQDETADESERLSTTGSGKVRVEVE